MDQLNLALSISLIPLSLLIDVLCIIAAVLYNRKSDDYRALMLLSISTVLTWFSVFLSRTFYLLGIHQEYLCLFLVMFNLAALFKVYAFTYASRPWLWKASVVGVIVLDMGVWLWGMQ